MRKIRLLHPALWAAMFLRVKETISIPSYILLVMLFFIACKKESLNADNPQNPANEQLISKIKSWLDEQKNGLPANSVARIDSLKGSLVYNELRLEKYRESNEFIIVPISNEFKSRNNSNKNPVSYLVLVFENQDSITRGNIIQYISPNAQENAPQNTFSKIFTYQNLDCSGQFTVLSVTDFFKYELRFENGKLKSVADQRPRAAANTSSGRVNNCTNWYLITTLYYTDGTSASYEEYLFTSCTGDHECQNTRVANGRSLQITCGGGGGNGIEYEYVLSKPLIWQVQTSVHWRVFSNETVSGVKKANEPQGGHFTSIVHGSSYLTLNVDNAYSWQELANTMSVDNPQTVSAYVTGKLTRNYNGTYYIFDEHTTESFASIFP